MGKKKSSPSQEKRMGRRPREHYSASDIVDLIRQLEARADRMRGIIDGMASAKSDALKIASKAAVKEAIDVLTDFCETGLNLAREVAPLPHEWDKWRY